MPFNFKQYKNLKSNLESKKDVLDKNISRFNKNPKDLGAKRTLKNLAMLDSSIAKYISNNVSVSFFEETELQEKMVRGMNNFFYEINPTVNDLQNLIDMSEKNSIRGVYIKHESKFYAWDALVLEHYHFIKKYVAGNDEKYAKQLYEKSKVFSFQWDKRSAEVHSIFDYSHFPKTLADTIQSFILNYTSKKNLKYNRKKSNNYYSMYTRPVAINEKRERTYFLKGLNDYLVNPSVSELFGLFRKSLNKSIRGYYNPTDKNWYYWDAYHAIHADFMKEIHMGVMPEGYENWHDVAELDYRINIDPFDNTEGTSFSKTFRKNKKFFTRFANRIINEYGWDVNYEMFFDDIFVIDNPDNPKNKFTKADADLLSLLGETEAPANVSANIGTGDVSASTPGNKDGTNDYILGASVGRRKNESEDTIEESNSIVYHLTVTYPLKSAKAREHIDDWDDLILRTVGSRHHAWSWSDKGTRDISFEIYSKQEATVAYKKALKLRNEVEGLEVTSTRADLAESKCVDDEKLLKQLEEKFTKARWVDVGHQYDRGPITLWVFRDGKFKFNKSTKISQTHGSFDDFYYDDKGNYGAFASGRIDPHRKEISMNINPDMYNPAKERFLVKKINSMYPDYALYNFGTKTKDAVLQEKFTKGFSQPHLINPTYNELYNLYKKSKWDSIRTLMINDDLYAWDAYGMIHHQFVNRELIEYSKGKVKYNEYKGFIDPYLNSGDGVTRISQKIMRHSTWGPIHKKLLNKIADEQNMDWQEDDENAYKINYIRFFDPNLNEEIQNAEVEPDEFFAGKPVFNVPDDVYETFRTGKNRYHAWNKHLNTEEDSCKKVYEYAKKNPGSPMVVKCKAGYMYYVRPDKG